MHRHNIKLNQLLITMLLQLYEVICCLNPNFLNHAYDINIFFFFTQMYMHVVMSEIKAIQHHNISLLILCGVLHLVAKNSFLKVTLMSVHELIALTFQMFLLSIKRHNLVSPPSRQHHFLAIGRICRLPAPGSPSRS